jgi:tRNA threonylcarbamoyladenosine biosynthesis protein TsaE
MTALKLKAESEQAQESLGAAMAEVCPTSCVIYLDGDLGTGKTTLVRGFLRGLGHRGTVKSPTYTLLEPYELAARRCFHFDLYRLAHPEELEYLGIRDLLETEAVLLIEWPDKGEGGLPAADLRVLISHLDRGRRLEFHGSTEVGKELIQRLSNGLPEEVKKIRDE